MSSNRRWNKLSPGLWLTLPLLASCQTGPAFVSPHLTLGAPEGQPVTAVNPAAAADSTHGQVTIRFEDVLPRARQLLSTLADVDHVVVTLNVGTPPMSVTVPKASITAGQASATFTGVPVGAVTFTVTVLDASGATIGSTSGRATVVAGQTATVTANFNLLPVYATPAPTSGGGGTSTTGGLQTNIGLSDSPTVQPLTMNTRFTTATPVTKVLSTDGNTFWGSGCSQIDYSDVLKFDRSGQTLAHPSAMSSATGAFTLLGTGVAAIQEVHTNINLVHLAADGSTTSSQALAGGSWNSVITIASDGAAWIRDHSGTSGLDGIRRVAADGSVTTFDTGRTLLSIANGDGGSVYDLNYVWSLQGGSAHSLEKRGPDGTQLWSVEAGTTLVNPMALGVDAANHLWVLDYTGALTDACRLVEFAPDGHQVSVHALPTNLGQPIFEIFGAMPPALICKADGTKYVGLTPADGSSISYGFSLVKCAADGSVLGSYYSPELQGAFTSATGYNAVGANELILSTGNGEIIYQLP